MRVAALYDVHANVPALEAVLAEVEREGVDTVLFGGDLTWGPEPVEALALVRSVPDARFVRGNCDREPDEWERSQLSEEDLAFLQGLPETLELDGVLYCHGTPRSDLEVVTPATTDEELAGDVFVERLPSRPTHRVRCRCALAHDPSSPGSARASGSTEERSSGADEIPEAVIRVPLRNPALSLRHPARAGSSAMTFTVTMRLARWGRCVDRPRYAR